MDSLYISCMANLKYRLKPKYIFGVQRRGAKKRGIAFHLTFEEWWDIWQSSGHWHERGKSKGQYCMARYGDEGDYEVGNVKIIPFGDNVREAQMGNQHTIGFKHSPEFRAAQSARMMGNKRALGLV